LSEIQDSQRTDYAEGVIKFENRNALLIDMEKLLEANYVGKG